MAIRPRIMNRDLDIVTLRFCAPTVVAIPLLKHQNIPEQIAIIMAPRKVLSPGFPYQINIEYPFIS